MERHAIDGAVRRGLDDDGAGGGLPDRRINPGSNESRDEKASDRASKGRGHVERIGVGGGIATPQATRTLM